MRGFLLPSLSILLLPVFTLAWTGPTASAPNGNIAAPVNIGSVNQVKNANLGVNGLAVFGNAILSGVGNYLNFRNTSGSAGYGLRNNSGTLEFKNSGGLWTSLNSLVQNYFTLNAGTQGLWYTSGSNSVYYMGNVGIGTTNPQDQLHLRETNNSSDTEIWLEYSGSAGGTARTYSIGTFNDGTFRIRDRSGGGTRLTLTAAGNLALGNFDTPSYMLDVNGSARLGSASKGGLLVLSADSDSVHLRPSVWNGDISITDDSESPSRGLTVANGGNIGIGTASPGAKLDVVGNVNASSYSQSSDARLKQNVQPLPDISGIAAIEALKPVSFNWLNPQSASTTQFGFVAQDVQKVLPNLVAVAASTTYTPDGTLNLNYIGLIAPMVKAIQEQQSEIDTLKQQNETLQKEVDTLQSKH